MTPKLLKSSSVSKDEDVFSCRSILDEKVFLDGFTVRGVLVEYWKFNFYTALRAWENSVSLPVFLHAAGFNIVLIGFGGLFAETAGNLFENTLDFIITTFGWYDVLTTVCFRGVRVVDSRQAT